LKRPSEKRKERQVSRQGDDDLPGFPIGVEARPEWEEDSQTEVGKNTASLCANQRFPGGE